MAEEFAMTKIFSSTALRDRQREVKEAADREVVHITENGSSAYIFCSEEVFEQHIARAVDEALYEAQVASAIERGLLDIQAGRYVEGIDAAREEVRRKRASRD